MTMETMKYNRKKLYTAADMLKAYIAKSKQVKRKAELFNLACELKAVYEYAGRNLNSALFDFYGSHCEVFYNNSCNHKNWTMKELRGQERNAMLFMANELNDILKMINYNPEKYELI